MDIILLVFVLLIVFSFIFNKNKSLDYLSVEQTTSLRGIAAIGIVMHHMSERTHGGMFFGYLAMIGYLLVALFFFLSGYGLLVQYKKRNDYLKNFLLTRVGYLIIVYTLDVILYALCGSITGKEHNIGFVFKTYFTSGVALNAWYMIAQMLFYIAFFVCFTVFKNKDTVFKIFTVFLCQVLFLTFCLITKASSTWYLSNFGFSLGLLWAEYKSKIDAFLSKKYIIAFICGFLAYVVFYGLPSITDRFLSENPAIIIRTVCRLISSPLSVAFLVIVVYKFKPVSFIFNYLGKISLEIYLIHGLVYNALRGPLIHINSEIIWTVLTLVISIALAIPISVLNKKINAAIKRRTKNVKSKS